MFFFWKVIFFFDFYFVLGIIIVDFFVCKVFIIYDFIFKIYYFFCGCKDWFEFFEVIVICEIYEEVGCIVIFFFVFLLICCIFFFFIFIYNF